MKFLEIFRFEFGYQIRRPWIWLFFAIVLVLSFLMTRDGAVSEVLYSEFFLNSPFAVALTTVFGGLIWLIMAAVVAGEAAARDVATGMHPLVYTNPISKLQYLGGKFLATLVLNALILLAVQGGILLGTYLPGVHPELIGPFRPEIFLTTFAFIALPNAFAATAIQFSLATKSGKTMAAYVGSFILIFFGFFIASMLLFKRSLGTLLDPIGIRFVVEDIAHLWTPIEKNTRLLTLEGPLLVNRLLWLGIGLLAILIIFLSFRFAHRTAGRFSLGSLRKSFRSSPKGEQTSTLPAGKGVITGNPIDVPQATPVFGFALHARQIFTISLKSFRSVAGSWAGLTVFIFIPLMTILVVLDQMGSMGTPIVPTTSRVLAELTGSMSNELSRWVIIPFLIIFFAGELVWRERDAGVGEITDTMPGSEWATFLGKFLGLGLVLVLLMALLTTAGIISQLIIGYNNFELALYLKVMFGLQLTEYLLFALLALVVHVVVDQKYIGHLVAIIAFVFISVIAAMLGIEHNLLIYGASPEWSHSEMMGFRASIEPWFWFKLYWVGWAILLAVAARLLWVRGREKSIGSRFKIARQRFTRSTKIVGGIAIALILTLGGFIFYNTNVLNSYMTSSEVKEKKAEYELRYGKFAGIPQPEMTATNLQVEIYPEQRAVEIWGTYKLVNFSKEPIDSIHIATGLGKVETREISFDQSANLAISDQEFGHHIYVLEEAIQPCDSIELKFEVYVENRGFSNRGVNRELIEKASFFTSLNWFPLIGYQRGRELINPADRREYGLKPNAVIASLHEVEEGETASRGGGIEFAAIVSTGKDQVAVAPGALIKKWTEGDRNYFQYSTDAPIGNEWAFFSADFTLHKEEWKNPDPSGRDINIQIFHYSKHTTHVNRIKESVKPSLKYYSEQYGPYPFGHITLVEHPGGTGTGGHADANIISYGQGFEFWIPENEKSLNFPYFVIAHEVAHQWTLPYAIVEGLPFLSEGLATYSAIQVVKDGLGEEQHRRLMNQLRYHYPIAPIRRGEPLLRALDPYLAYRRGPYAMYALSEYVGADEVNGAIKTLIEKHESPNAPLATTLHLYHELQEVTPDSLNYLLYDLFEVNTYWEFKTENAIAKQKEDGNWEVTLDVKSQKSRYDSAGEMMEPPIDDWVQIGIFSGKGFKEPLHLEMHRITGREQKITITVTQKPVRAGIDPYRLLDWEQGSGDNIQEVKIEK